MVKNLQSPCQVIISLRIEMIASAIKLIEVRKYGTFTGDCGLATFEPFSSHRSKILTVVSYFHFVTKVWAFDKFPERHSDVEFDRTCFVLAESNQ